MDKQDSMEDVAFIIIKFDAFEKSFSQPSRNPIPMSLDSKIIEHQTQLALLITIKKVSLAAVVWRVSI